MFACLDHVFTVSWNKSLSRVLVKFYLFRFKWLFPGVSWRNGAVSFVYIFWYATYKFQNEQGVTWNA